LAVGNNSLGPGSPGPVRFCSTGSSSKSSKASPFFFPRSISPFHPRYRIRSPGSLTLGQDAKCPPDLLLRSRRLGLPFGAPLSLFFGISHSQIYVGLLPQLLMVFPRTGPIRRCAARFPFWWIRFLQFRCSSIGIGQY